MTDFVNFPEHIFAGGVPFLKYLVTSIFLLVVFARIYLWVTPYDEMREIREGKMAPAVAFTGALIGFAIAIRATAIAGANIVDFALWAIVVGVVQVICFKALYWILPKQVENDNVAASILYAGCAISVGLLSAAAITP